MELVEVRPDRAAFEEWYAVYAAAHAFGRGDCADTWQRDELAAMLVTPSRAWEHHVYAGLVDGRVVATGWLSLPLLDNRWRGDVEVHVLPEVRRRGHGSRMLAHLEGVVRAEGRTMLLAEVPWPYDGGPTGSGPGCAFARFHGFELGLADVQRQLTLPVPEERLDRLAAEAARSHADYQLQSWTGPVPDQLLGQWAELNASLDTEAPTGTLHIEPSTADVDAVRDEERLRTRQGRLSLHTVAVRADGRLAAYTELVVATLEPGRAYQWGTLVRREDRGHRLGTAVKVANLRQLQRTRPEVRRVVTYNAESNTHMIDVNAALGFAATERLGEFQRRLAR